MMTATTTEVQNNFGKYYSARPHVWPALFLYDSPGEQTEEGSGESEKFAESWG